MSCILGQLLFLYKGAYILHFHHIYISSNISKQEILSFSDNTFFLKMVWHSSFRDINDMENANKQQHSDIINIWSNPDKLFPFHASTKTIMPLLYISNLLWDDICCRPILGWNMPCLSLLGKGNSTPSGGSWGFTKLTGRRANYYA